MVSPEVRPSTGQLAARLKKWAISAIGVIFLLGALLSGWHWASSYRIRREIQAIQRHGGPVRLAELIAELGPHSSEDEQTKYFCEALIALGAAPFETAYNRLPYVGPEGVLTSPNPTEPWVDLAIAERFLAERAPAFSLLDKAVHRGHGPRIRVTFQHGLQLLEPDGETVTDAFRAVQLRWLAARFHRDDASVVNAIRLLFVVSRELCRQPFPVAQYNGWAFLRAWSEMLEVTLAETTLSDEVLTEIQTLLEEIDLERNWRQCLIGSRVIGIVAWDDPGAIGVASDFFSRIACGQQLPEYLSLMNQYITAAQMPMPAALDRVFEVDNQPQSQRLRFPTGPLLPAFQHVADITARLRCLIAAVAVIRFQRRNVSIPGCLEQLMPNQLRSVPIDPFSGASIRLVINNDESFLLYSVGHNRKDDGGFEPVRPENGGDICIRLSR
jgi:hypothetical protein